MNGASLGRLAGFQKPTAGVITNFPGGGTSKFARAARGRKSLRSPCLAIGQADDVTLLPHLVTTQFTLGRSLKPTPGGRASDKQEDL